MIEEQEDQFGAFDLKAQEISTNASLKNKDIDKKAETAKYVANKRPIKK